MTTEFVKDQYGKSLSKWGVSGGSKRGWTAWLTAAVDPERVKLIVPVVCDFLNFRDNFLHSHLWSFMTFYRSNAPLVS